VVAAGGGNGRQIGHGSVVRTTFSDPIIIVTIKRFFQKAVAEMTDRVVRNADLARAGDAERLAGFSPVATESVDEAAELIGRIFCPHDLKPLRASGPGFYARHNCAGFDGFSVNYVAYRLGVDRSRLP
jgi:hypothetical protein